jgi:hypothetical protein
MVSKNTDIIQKAEQQLLEEIQILKDPNVGKERKQKAKKNIKSREKYLRDTSNEEINGKTYPTNYLYHSDDKPMDKKEIFKLIDSVETPDPDGVNEMGQMNSYVVILDNGCEDLSGVFIKGK